MLPPVMDTRVLVHVLQVVRCMKAPDVAKAHGVSPPHGEVSYISALQLEMDIIRLFLKVYTLSLNKQSFNLTICDHE
jgi:hypothetical protein